jgi:hypothetical protein
MSAFKGTPGPWEAKRTDPQEWAINAPNGDPALKHGTWYGLAVAYGCDESPSVGREVAKANARLIAAAPELLEACQTFAEWLRREKEGLPVGIERDTPEGERQWCTWWEEYLRIYALAQQQVIAAIAKATGEQP